MALFVLAVWRSPTYSFHPTCTYSAIARVSAEVEIGEEKLSSTVVYQQSHSRQWIALLNSGGCQPLYGTALIYKLADDRVLIVPTRICHSGTRELSRTGRINYLDVCTGKQATQDHAFLVDSASSPRRWYSVTNGIDFRIVSMTAVSTWSSPADDIASIAPNLLMSKFKHGPQKWSASPERIISFERRYNEWWHRPDKQHEFDVNNVRF